MQKKYFLLTAVLALSLLTSGLIPAKAESLGRQLSGRILLQVEENGEAWYISKIDNKRYYMGRPEDAFQLMRELGNGISNADLKKIPIAMMNYQGTDSDGDALSIEFEDAIGTNKLSADSDNDGYDDFQEIFNGYDPLNSNSSVKMPHSSSFAASNAGRIFLQVENHGEAWYINPLDNKRYFLGRPNDAFSLMRGLGLGITNANLNQINCHPEHCNLPENNTMNLTIVRNFSSCDMADNHTTYNIYENGGYIKNLKLTNCEYQEAQILAQTATDAYFSILPGGLGGYILYGTYTNLYKYNFSSDSVDKIAQVSSLTDIDVFSGKLAYTMTNPKQVVVFNLTTGYEAVYALPENLQTAGIQIGDLKFSPDGNNLALAASYGPEGIWGKVYTLNLNSGQFTLYASSEDYAVKILGWDGNEIVVWQAM